MNTIRTPNSFIRRYATPLLTDVTQVDVREVTNQVVSQLFEDEGFKQILHLTVRNTVSSVIRQMVAQTRGALIPMGTEIVSAREFSRRARALSNKFQNWMEHAGDKYHLLSVMTREDFLQAAEEREARGIAEFNLSGLWRSVAGELQPGQTPPERWGDNWTKAIESLSQELAAEILIKD